MRTPYHPTPDSQQSHLRSISSRQHLLRHSALTLGGPVKSFARRAIVRKTASLCSPCQAPGSPRECDSGAPLKRAGHQARLLRDTESAHVRVEYLWTEQNWTEAENGKSPQEGKDCTAADRQFCLLFGDCWELAWWTPLCPPTPIPNPATCIQLYATSHCREEWTIVTGPYLTRTILPNNTRSYISVPGFCDVPVPLIYLLRETGNYLFWCASQLTG